MARIDRRQVQRFVGFVVEETNRAVLFLDHFWHGAVWLPKSQSTLHRSTETAEVIVDASGWICGQKDLREFEEREDGEGDGVAGENPPQA